MRWLPVIALLATAAAVATVATPTVTTGCDDARAIYIEALALEDGNPATGEAPDSATALIKLRQAAAMRLPAALNYLGFKYIKGDGMVQDVDSGISLIEQAAALGDAQSYNNLGWLYADGRYVQRDYSRAAEWLRRASDAGIGAASSMLADLLATGSGIAPDTLGADTLYRLAAQRGMAQADYKLLTLHKATYDTLSPDSAVRLAIESFEQRLPATGAYLATHAAAQGHARAHTLLGYAYSTALGVPYSHQQTLTHFYLGACGGDAPAEFIVAETLDMFPDALLDLDQSLLRPDTPIENQPDVWYERAALGGVSDAETALRRIFTTPDTITNQPSEKNR